MLLVLISSSIGVIVNSIWTWAVSVGLFLTFDVYHWIPVDIVVLEVIII